MVSAVSHVSQRNLVVYDSMNQRFVVYRTFYDSINQSNLVAFYDSIKIYRLASVIYFIITIRFLSARAETLLVLQAFVVDKHMISHSNFPFINRLKHYHTLAKHFYRPIILEICPALA